jgi:GH24 family phage-related lysozyme (muramidase)
MSDNTNPAFYLGVVEDRMDPLMLGRVRVRVLGLHTHDKALLPTADLPWAYKIQSTTSGAISGIGHAPVGVMEGTWVIVQYIDPEKQMPFVVGTMGGIPQDKNPPLESFELLNQESNVVTTSDGTPVTTSDGTPVTTESTTPVDPLKAAEESIPVRSASEFSPSEVIVDKLKKSERFRSAPYDDGVGVWTIGYGSTFLADGSRVTPDTPPITEKQADELLRLKLKTDFEPSVKKNVRVPITQSMYDSLVHLAYNVGGGGIRTFIAESGLNSSDYRGCATYMLNYRVRPGTAVERGLRNRREFEKNWFLQDGVPTKTGDLEETPQSIQKEEAIRDADPLNQTVQDSTFRRSQFNGALGFKDPQDRYPLKTHLSEPDTNRLARNQKIRQTVIYKKELAEHKGVPKANGKGSWNQSPTPYNSTYPFNNVWQSESGHILEFDDTRGSERVHLYHNSGTFMEVDVNGTRVNRIVGDGYEIYERNGYLHVVGNLDITVNGAKTLRVENTLDVEVHGATTINIHDNAKLNVAGDFDITAGGNIKLSAGGVIHGQAGGNIAFDGARVDLNSGFASSLPKIGRIGGTPVSFPQLTVPNRKEEAAAIYETPEDGTPEEIEAYKQRRIAEGTATREELEAPPTVEGRQAVKPNNVPEKEVESDVPPGTKEFDCSQKISKYYTLGDLTAGCTRKLRDQAGLTADQIYANLKRLAVNVLDPLKEKYPNMKINSCLRLENTSSQHNKGQAVDVSFPGLSRADLYDRVLEVQKIVPHDQMLLEYLTPGGNGWIHISFVANGNRGQVFTMNNHKRVGSIGTFTKIA